MNQVEYLEPSLAQVVERIGTRYVTVVGAPRGVEVPVSGPAIHDPLSSVPPRPGSMVLLVGLTAGSPEAAATLRGLGGATAAVLRADARDAAPLAEAAAQAGVALVALESAMSWSHLHTLVEETVLLGENLVAAPGGDLGSVPVGDLNTLVNLIAETLDRPVGIVDTQWRLLAYSAVPGQVNDDLQRDVILNRVVPERNAPRETRRLLLTTGRALRFLTNAPYDTADHTIWRVGAGIRGGQEPLGMLWVLEGRDQLPDDRLVLVEEFARLAAAHLLRARTARTADRERHGELVGQALDGTNPRTACRRLGLDPDAGIAVLAVAGLSLGADDPPGEHLLDGVATYFDAYRRSAACVLRAETVYCLVPTPDLTTLREIAADLVRQLGRRGRLVAAIGGRVPAEALPRSRREADLALAALRASAADPGATAGSGPAGGPGSAVGTIDEVRAAATLIELRALLEDHPGLLLHEADPALPTGTPSSGTPSSGAPSSGALSGARSSGALSGARSSGALSGALSSGARASGALSETAESALAWIESHGDVRAAARRLGVHPNTLRYRVRKLAADGLDLSDPQTRLVTWLRLRLL
ncbi:PucR family transcriptional regulator [Streptosporangium jomthongense]|uniref:PucR family transcriptional regulator n=1 Tax=Streptosporangium jomthongense TaxID=1193683 RepID=A0ABV8FFT6_9ACTN